MLSKNLIILVAFVFSGLIPNYVGAVGADAHVTATIISSGQVLSDAAVALTPSSSGVLTLSIPGGGGASGATIELTASGVISSGAPTVFSASDGAALTQLIAQLATSGGTLTTSGTLSGSGVQIVVTQVAPGGDGAGTVTAVVTYN